MDLTFRIFHYSKPKGWNFTLSEKISYYCLFTALVIAFIFFILEKYFSIKYSPLILIILIFGNLVGMTLRFREFENLNGFFEGKISFEKDAFIINNKKYLHNLISKLVINYNDYYGSKTNNYKYGPSYTNGVSNKISFYYENKFLEYQFEINNSSEIDKLDFYLIDIICNEKIPYQRSNLDLIPRELTDFPDCEKFIIKLIKDKQINQIEGLLIIGYNTDKKVKEIKEKYNLL